jgi:uncharacterized protein (TIGR02246 family)
MSAAVSDSDREAFVRIVRELESAWNAGDGAAFGAPMTEDADFVTIRAEHFRGRQAIVAGHAAIFRTVYAGSTNRYSLESARALRECVALIHVRATLEVPTGPLVGRHEATFSAVLVLEEGAWQIASFHNTLAPPSPPTRP